MFANTSPIKVVAGTRSVEGFKLITEEPLKFNEVAQMNGACLAFCVNLKRVITTGNYTEVATKVRQAVGVDFGPEVSMKAIKSFTNITVMLDSIPDFEIARAARGRLHHALRELRLVT